MTETHMSATAATRPYARFPSLIADNKFTLCISREKRKRSGPAMTQGCLFWKRRNCLHNTSLAHRHSPPASRFFVEISRSQDKRLFRVLRPPSVLGASASTMYPWAPILSIPSPPSLTIGV
ncbi:hypothetical protein PG995_006893 [Apiospora arundinis]